MKNWSLNAKVTFIICILSIGAMTIGYFGLSKMSYIKSLLTEITGTLVKRSEYVSSLRDEQRMITIHNKNIVIEKDKSKVEKLEAELSPLRTELFKSLDDYSQISSSEGKELARQYKDAAEKWINSNTELRRLIKADKDSEAAQYTEAENEPSRIKAVDLLDEMSKLTSKRLDEATAESESSYTSARNLVLLVTTLSLLLSGALAAFIMRSVSKAIDQVIASLNDNSSQVTAAAQQIAASSEQLSQAATEQASSLEETASSIEEMNSMVQKNSENARKSSEVSTTSHQSATRGKEVVEEMIRAIEAINSSNQQIAEIVKVISEIGSKTKVINDIVFQTKLLSFNASVEAARAGEHGKGFAVVAEEVGKLAQMSGNAAKEISTMLDGSMQKVEGIVNETKTKVESGTKIAQQCGEVLGDIVTNVSSVNQMMGEISTACQEQSQGVQEITKAMSQLDQVTQENASTSEEAASAAEELAAQSESLRGVVKLLTETIKGSNGERHTGAPSHVSGPALHAKESGRSAGQSFEGGKVLHMKNGAARKNSSKFSGSGGSHELKKVVGMDSGVPSEDDTRFKDV
jgi:methyl-accepting chemotaxis protein